MDNSTIQHLVATGKQRKLEIEVMRLLKANTRDYKRIDARGLLVQKGVSPKNIERLMSSPHGEKRVEDRPHHRPDKEARKATKKRMRGRR